MNTSYFSNLKNLKNPLSISIYPPKWYLGPQFKLLAPTQTIIRAYKDLKISDEEYVNEFKKHVLEPLDAFKVHSDLVTKFGSDVTLLCYEKPGDFCHRRLVAEWFELKLGIEVPELPSAGFYNSLKKEM